MIGIINYIGNIGSVKNALDYLEIPNFIADKPSDLKKATHIIIPGVGNWTEGVKRLKPFYKYLKSTKKPILGICLGFQLMAETSEEGMGKGLNILMGSDMPGRNHVYKLPKQHVGWDMVWTPEGHKCYYFTHGYGVDNYAGGYYKIFNNYNITGVQFHPEKSQKDGLDYLKEWFNKTGGKNEN